MLIVIKIAPSNKKSVTYARSWVKERFIIFPSSFFIKAILKGKLKRPGCQE